MRVSWLGRCGIILTLGGQLAGCGRIGLAPAPAALPGTASSSVKGQRVHDLLYVSSARATVNVYRYWQGGLEGALTDFSEPLGECADSAGNVYIVDGQRERIYEYAQGASKPLRVLNDEPYTPYGCSVSTSNGNVAVANGADGSKAVANVAIYPHGTGKPIHLNGIRPDRFTGCAYDDRSDLLAVSQYKRGDYWHVEFYYRPKNGTKLLPINLRGIPHASADFVEGVAWDGRYWVAGPVNNALLLYSIGLEARAEGTVKLNPGSSSQMGAISFYRLNSKVRATQVVGATNVNSIEFFYYPGGGIPIGKITKDVEKPAGIAVSLGT